MRASNVAMVKREHPVLEIKTTPAKIEIRRRNLRVKVSSAMPRMTVNKKAPSFSMDAQALRAANGRPTGVDKARQTSSQAQQDGLEAIGKIAQNGDMLMRPDLYDVADVASMRTAQEAPQVNLGLVPDTRPQLEWTEGYFEVEWSEPERETSWEGQVMPDIEVTPHSVEINVRYVAKEHAVPARPQGKTPQAVPAKQRTGPRSRIDTKA